MLRKNSYRPTIKIRSQTAALDQTLRTKIALIERV